VLAGVLGIVSLGPSFLLGQVPGRPGVKYLPPSVAASPINVARYALRKDKPVIVVIDTVMPPDIWQNQTFVVRYVVFNQTSRALSGTVTATYGYSGMYPERGVSKVTISRFGNVTGYLDGEATNLGQELIQVRFASDSETCALHRIATVPVQLIKVCGPAVADTARQTLNVTHTSADIISSSDALPAVGPAGAEQCGSDTYPMGLYSTEFEWWQRDNGEDVPMLGTVIDIKGPKTDLVWDHPFGYDYTFNLAVAPSYLRLLNAPSLPSVVGYCNPVDPVRADGDICAAYSTAAQQGVQPLGVLHNEFEYRLVPPAYRPVPGDRVFMHGHSIVDCGHPNYTTEIHPPTLLARAHRDPSTGSVHSTLIALPYLTKQWYDIYNQTLVHTVALEVTGYEFAAPIDPAGGPLIVLAQVANTPFANTLIATYRVAVPSMPNRWKVRLHYHFITRPGVTVTLNAVSPYEVEIRVTLDPAGYSRLEPSCASVSYTLEHAEIDAGRTPGTLRGLVNVIGGSGLLSPTLDGIANAGLIVRQCDVPNSEPLEPETAPDNVVVVDATQPYPIIGWLDFDWESPMMMTHFPKQPYLVPHVLPH